ncbi:MAG: hypothetical protein V3S01_06795 [Dehalococcoidia bacterium]
MNEKYLTHLVTPLGSELARLKRENTHMARILAAESKRAIREDDVVLDAAIEDLTARLKCKRCDHLPADCERWYCGSEYRRPFTRVSV